MTTAPEVGRVCSVTFKKSAGFVILRRRNAMRSS